ncbi:MAG TPA: TIGR03000 domain-containing protein [Gemmataceae bacterium]|nr:TIGR03000 domain-containing protein [Gemmataceae bacterium]
MVQAATVEPAPKPAAPDKPAPKPANQGTSAPKSATIQVALAADARLYVDGEPVALTSTTQSFLTPQLEPGREYFYTFKAEAIRDGKTVSETRRVSFRAGEVTRVDFGPLNAPPTAPARITVRLPADARLYVDEVLCTLTSDTRSFQTPPLEVGKTYAYTLKAEVQRNGRTQTESRRILVQAGKQTTVEFNELVVQVSSNP